MATSEAVTSLEFTGNTLNVQCDQVIASLRFTDVTVANNANQANVTSSPFERVVVRKNDGTEANYLLQTDTAKKLAKLKTYIVTGPGNTGFISLTDSSGVTAAKFQQ
ncbi:uncharacterized protein DFL_004534 [Arthrobotrys flagrans]|uniref:Uncharacterized protein n=1 Tax=Arthrobotrys flagrans TaxID=97331 RepID=A0A437A5C3_ARTFL|nr:hypothetical protein DFL_004534 [Arthrobotrys flagrans]